jgi:DNA-binding LytR/AlgR family response regulator
MLSIQLLIVEDNFLVAAEIQSCIELLGFAVSAIVDNGSEALDEVKNNKPDLVIMDIHLKGKMDGIETANILAKKYEVPIIFLTDQSDEETYQKAKSAFPHAFLSKPVDAVSLKRSIELAVSMIQKSEKLQEGESNGKVLNNSYLLKIGSDLNVIKLEDIKCLIANGSYCEIRTHASKYLTSKPMKAVLDSLYESEFSRTNIIKISRSCAININKIEQITGNKVTVLGEEFSIGGKEYRDKLLQLFQTL